MNRRLIRFALQVAITGVVFLLAACSREPGSAQDTVVAGDSAAEHALKHADPAYRCPMHPDVVSDEPGECPICGMKLVRIEYEPEPAAGHSPAAGAAPLYYRHPHDPGRTSPVPAKDEMGMDYVAVFADAEGPVVRISPAVVNNLGVRTEPAAQFEFTRSVEAVGYVSYDERRVRQVRSRAEGWIEGLAVRAVGDTVKNGELLFNVYSPTLESAQQEYLDALAIGNDELIGASRSRLVALGLDPGTASRLARHGRAVGRVAFVAPASGVVTELSVQEGAMVTPDRVVMSITELDSVWVIAEVPESSAAWVVPGTAAELTLPSMPGSTVRGQVEYVYPALNPDTRTLRARITLEAPPASIRPNMLANVSLTDSTVERVLGIPRDAVIRGGTEDRVVIALGEGRFMPRRVLVGAESGGRIAILEGLAEGERVVVAGQFLLDSEANLRAGLRRMSDVPASTASDTTRQSPDVHKEHDSHQH
jgi:Cu(I)/Ag(I) efflux system membrane fusion protein